MIVTVAISELMEHFGVNGLAEARDQFQSMAASELPDPKSGLSSSSVTCWCGLTSLHFTKTSDKS